jgi:hypothetical protein
MAPADFLRQPSPLMADPTYRGFGRPALIGQQRFFGLHGRISGLLPKLALAQAEVRRELPPPLLGVERIALFFRPIPSFRRLHERDLDVLVEPLRIRLDAFVQVHPALGNLRGDPLPFGSAWALTCIIGRIRLRLDRSGFGIEHPNLGRRIVRAADNGRLTLFGLLVMPICSCSCC